MAEAIIIKAASPDEHVQYKPLRMPHFDESKKVLKLFIFQIHLIIPRIAKKKKKATEVRFDAVAYTFNDGTLNVFSTALSQW